MPIFTPASNMVFTAEAVQQNSFDLELVTNDTFETIGRTGGSSDYAWTALDSIPQGSSAIYVSSYIGVVSDAASSVLLSLFANRSTSNATGDLKLIQYAQDSTTLGETIIRNGNAWIPLAADSFSIYIQVFNASFDDGATLHLIAYV